MTAAIRAYRPQVKVLIDHVDYTDSLADVGSVRTYKHLQAPAGEVHINFADKPTAARDSIYGAIKNMARIEVWMRRWQDEEVKVGNWVAVLRGFVRSIGRDEQVGGDGRVQRQVTIVGHDCGSPFLMEQIHPFISYQHDESKAAPPGAFHWLRMFGLNDMAYRVKDFIWKLADTSSANIMKSAGWKYDPQLSVEKGYVLPHMSTSTQGSVWQELKHYSDSPWNELFVREGEKSPEFVFRPAPWRDIEDKPLDDDAKPGPFHIIPIRNVVSLQAARSDAELANLIRVLSPITASIGLAMPIFIGDTQKVNNETIATHGDRLQIMTTVLMPNKAAPLNQPQAQQLQEQIGIADWIKERTTWAWKAAKQIHEFENGSITIKGNPLIRVGDYITVERGEIKWDGYVVGVSHDFQPFRRYLTNIEYIRGNQWVRRLKIKQSWDKERKQESGT
jgi:hypothetical protein